MELFYCYMCQVFAWVTGLHFFFNQFFNQFNWFKKKGGGKKKATQKPNKTSQIKQQNPSNPLHTNLCVWQFSYFYICDGGVLSLWVISFVHPSKKAFTTHESF